MEKEFGVNAKSFFLIEAFKKEAEKEGWKYNSKFTEFSQNEFNNGLNLHFKSNWFDDNDYLFSLSRTRGHLIFNLPEDWDKAMDFIKIEGNAIVEITMQEIAEWKGVEPNRIRIKR